MTLHIGSCVEMENEKIRIICSIQGFSNSNVFFGPFIVIIKGREDTMVRSSSLGVFTRNEVEWTIRVL